MSIPVIHGGRQAFTDYLGHVINIVAAQRGADLLAGAPLGAGEVCWTLWLDPGTHTGLASAVYFRMPEGAREGGEVEAVRWWERALTKGQLRVNASGGVTPAGEYLAETLRATGRLVLASHAEFLSGPENEIVRDAVGRVRRLGKVWAGTTEWDALPPDGAVAGGGDPYVWCGLGGAGVGVERFVNLRAERGEDYLSPVRVTAAFEYALADEFGLDVGRQTSADMAATFPPRILSQIGHHRAGPDHVRDALGHVMLAIRKNG